MPTLLRQLPLSHHPNDPKEPKLSLSWTALCYWQLGDTARFRTSRYSDICNPVDHKRSLAPPCVYLVVYGMMCIYKVYMFVMPKVRLVSGCQPFSRVVPQHINHSSVPLHVAKRPLFGWGERQSHVTAAENETRIVNRPPRVEKRRKKKHIYPQPRPHRLLVK